MTAATRIIDRAAVFCYGCNKAHQLRLIERSGRGVAVVGGQDLRFPGDHLDAKETFDLGVALVARFTDSESNLCPFNGASA